MILVRLVAPLAALTLALAACSDDDPDPRVDPTPTTPTSTVTPTPDPSGTTEPGPLGPMETVRAWVQARNHLVQSGDATAVDRLSASDCSTCRDSTDPVEQVYVAGGHYETHGWRIAAMKVTARNRSSAEVSAGLVYTAGQTVPSAGVEPVSYGIERHIAKFRLTKEGGLWKLRFLLYVS